METRHWQRGDTVPIWAEIRDPDTDALTDPSEDVKLTLTDPDGTVKVNNQTMTQSSTGKYVYYWLSTTDDAIGWYKAKVTVQDGTGTGARYVVEYSGFVLE